MSLEVGENDGLPVSDDEAAARYSKFRILDPLPKVPAALLSSEHIFDYAKLTGMIFPFEEKSLKSASYEAGIEGDIIFWKINDQKNSYGFEKTKFNSFGQKTFLLKANTIAYFQVKPKFRLPHYLAARFNLRITHVHRGLLLGTGPLVDPGFEGRIFVPVHNLTASDYLMDLEKALIWIEFTKTSFGTPGIRATPPQVQLPEKFKPFPDDKKNLKPEYYLEKANDGNPISSSIGWAVDDARVSARIAKAGVLRVETRLSWFLKFGWLALIIGCLGITYGGYSLVTSVITLVDSSNKEISALRQKVESLSTEIDALKAKKPAP